MLVCSKNGLAKIGEPKMTNSVFNQADKLAKIFESLGLEVSISKSENRNNQFSAYLTVSKINCRIRISDHDCNPDYRVAEINWTADISLGEVEKFLLNYANNSLEKRHAQEIEKLAKAKFIDLAEKNIVLDDFEAGDHYMTISKTREGGIFFNKVRFTKKGSFLGEFVGKCTHKGYVDLRVIPSLEEIQDNLVADNPFKKTNNYKDFF